MISIKISGIEYRINRENLKFLQDGLVLTLHDRSNLIDPLEAVLFGSGFVEIDGNLWELAYRKKDIINKIISYSLIKGE